MTMLSGYGALLGHIVPSRHPSSLLIY